MRAILLASMSQALFAVGVQANIDSECARLTDAWETFVLGKPETPGVRQVILDSWNRCLGSGLDARETRSPRVLSAEQVEDYLTTDPVFAEVKDVLPWLETAATDLGHLLVCCDASGHIMHLTGTGAVRRRADNMNFVPGADWSEFQAGTNAIGTAISTRSPIQVLGSEHYLQAAHGWTCSGAPIRDPATDAILAVIDLTGPKEVCQRHALLLVMMTAQLIEERLRVRHESERCELLDHYADQASRSAGSLMAVLDRSGRVVKASPGLHQRGWIDPHGRILGYSRAKRLGEGDASWEVDGATGRCSFALTPHVRRGLVAGSIVRVIKEVSHRAGVLSSGPPHPRASVTESRPFESLIGSSPTFRRALAIAQSSALSEFPVLIEGETGTGKELVAHAIHAASRRSAMPFVAVNCGALSRELATSEFFGYDAGSFTGAAKEGRIGKFEQANGGTLFLDEIGDMPMELQALLLRVVEDNKVVHLGGRRNIAVDVRVIAATNRNLLEASTRDAFRKDLYYRLNVVNIVLPPLRDRLEDIGPLLNAHLQRAFASVGQSAPRIPPDVMQLLEQHSWPGNVREIRNLAEWLAVNCKGAAVEVTDLPPSFVVNQVRSTDLSPDETSLKLRELDAIQSTLGTTGNVTEAARRLGIHRSTIYRKLGKLTPRK
jgi:transcriptional regulator of acetoin/glycerol metabolism